MQTTLVIIKPNGVQGGIIGEIIARYEKARLSIAALRIRNITREEADGFYAEHRGKGFFTELVDFMTSGPVVLLALRGEKAVEAVRQMRGDAGARQLASRPSRQATSTSKPPRARPRMRFKVAPTTRVPARSATTKMPQRRQAQARCTPIASAAGWRAHRQCGWARATPGSPYWTSFR